MSNKPVSENARLTKAASIVGSATLLSRLFGLIRDVVTAGFFGAGLFSDAFFVAFRIPNLLRSLFAEGSLSVAFIPVFTECYIHEGKAEAFKLAGAAVRWLAFLLLVVSIAGIFFSPFIIRFMAPGFAASPEKLSITIHLARMMFPYIFFIGMVALSMGILNVLGHFTAPALAPVVLNVAMICSVFVISPYMSDPVTGLAIGVLVGGFFQLAMQLPFLARKGFYFWHKTKLYHPGLKKIGRLMLPSIFGAAVYQINILISTLLASLLEEGSVSYLYYADRLVQFPLGIFAVATATAVLPSLSRQASARDFDSFRNTFSLALRLVLFMTIPSMAGLIVLREPIIGLLFERGAFDAQATRLTAFALLYYTSGLWAFAAVKIVVSTFYALQDTLTPVKIAAVSIAANLLLGIILMGPMGHGGLALSTSLASVLNLTLLVWVLRKRLGHLKWRNIFSSACKTVMCSAIMGGCVWMIAAYTVLDGKNTFLMLLGKISACLTAGAVIYVVLSFIMKSSELDTVMKTLKKSVIKSEQ